MATTKATELSQLSSALQVDESTGEIIFTGSLSVDSNTLFIDGDSNRVGIGTLTPGSALDVSGDVTATAFSGDGSALTSVDGATLDGLNSTQFLRSDTSDTLNGDLTVNGDLNVDSGTLFVDSANNRVGIGTSSPDADLEINSGGNNVPLGLTSTDDRCFISLRDDSTTLTHGNATVAVGARADDMLIRTGAAEAVRIGASGNVGIGTSSPSDKLEVYGSSPNILISNTTESLSGIKFEDANSSENAAIQFDSSSESLQLFISNSKVMQIDDNGHIGLGGSPRSNSPVTIVDGSNRSMNIGGDGQLRIEGNGYRAGFALDGDALNIYHNSSNRAIVFGTDETERARIAGNGDISFYEDTGTTPKFFWDASAERLGIGTSSPGEELHVNGTIQADKHNNVSGEYTTIAYRFIEGRGWGYNSEDDAIFYDAAGGEVPFILSRDDLIFQPNNNKVIHAFDGGNVAFYEDTGTTPKFFWDASAERLGIGTSSPNEALHIKGFGEGARIKLEADTSNSDESDNAEIQFSQDGGGVSGSIGLDAGTQNILQIKQNDQDGIEFQTGGNRRTLINSNGDISFYENTGTTPKFFWDASAETTERNNAVKKKCFKISLSADETYAKDIPQARNSFLKIELYYALFRQSGDAVSFIQGVFIKPHFETTDFGTFVETSSYQKVGGVHGTFSITANNNIIEIRKTAGSGTQSGDLYLILEGSENMTL